MTKQQLIELIRRNIVGGDSQPSLRGRFHDKEIELYIDMAIESLLNGYTSERQEMYGQLGLDAWKYDKFTKSYKLDIEFDEDTEKYFSTLPVKIT